MTRPLHSPHAPALKTALDLAPLAIFLLVFKWQGLLPATAALIGTTLLSLAVTYALTRSLALLPLITGVLVSVFGGLTLVLQDERFIKMKPTAVNLLFGVVLLAGVGFKKPLLKPLMGYALSLSERGWLLLSLRWGLFFIALAVLNEAIWRNFSTEFWVNFKVFGMLTLTLVFTLAQVPLVQRHPPAQE